MNIQDIFRLCRRNLFLILIITLSCSAAGSYFAHRINQNSFEGTAFLSISVKDKTQQSSSYENLEASDQLAESIQGWIKDPAFEQNIKKSQSYYSDIKAKKQEKNNLIISFSAPDQDKTAKFYQAIFAELQSRLKNYNSYSDLEANFSLQEFSLIQKDQTLIIIILAVLMGLLLGGIGAYCIESITGKITSQRKLKEITNSGQIIYFANEKNLKKNHHFLTAYLDQKYRGQKVQLIDLTSKTHTALEIISKHTDFSEIKAYKWPINLKNIKYDFPSIVITELGYSSTESIEEIKKLPFEKLEYLLFNQVRS